MIEVHGRLIPESLNEILEPSVTSLVIHDMQNDPCCPESLHSKVNGPIDCHRVLDKVLTLREAARKAGVLVMYSQYTNQPEWKSYSAFQLYQLRDRFGDPKREPILTNLYGTKGWEIIDELKPGPDEIRIFKYRRDTFIGTNFDNVLRSNGIKTIVSCGIALENGILPTAITASHLDYFPVIPRDAVSGRHQNLMDDAMKLLQRLAVVTDTSEIIQVWEAAPPVGPKKARIQST